MNDDESFKLGIVLSYLKTVRCISTNIITTL